MLVHLKVLVDGLVLMVLISVCIVLQKCMGYLEKKIVFMFGCFGWLWALPEFLGKMVVGAVLVVVD